MSTIGPITRTFTFEVGIASAIGTISQTHSFKAKTLHQAESLLDEKMKGKDYKVVKIAVF